MSAWSKRGSQGATSGLMDVRDAEARMANGSGHELLRDCDSEDWTAQAESRWESANGSSMRR